MNPAFRALSAGILLAASSGAFAQGPHVGFYLGGALGQSSLRNWCGDASATFIACDDQDLGWKVVAGYQVNSYFGIEASYIDWGETTASVRVGGEVRDVLAKQHGLGIAAIGSLAVGPQFSVFGKLGLVFVEQETRRIRPAPLSIDRDETETQYGLGAKYRLLRNLAVRAEIERTDKRQSEATTRAQLISLGVEYRF